jgi:hypothetical protein
MARPTLRELREAENDKRRAAFDRDVAAGRLTVRQMTREERQSFDARRAATSSGSRATRASMAQDRTPLALRAEAIIACQRLALYRHEMARGRGDTRVLAARERVREDALRDLRRALLALDA